MTAASTRARCGSDEDYQPSVLPTDSAEDPHVEGVRHILAYLLKLSASLVHDSSRSAAKCRGKVEQVFSVAHTNTRPAEATQASVQSRAPYRHSGARVQQADGSSHEPASRPRVSAGVTSGGATSATTLSGGASASRAPMRQQERSVRCSALVRRRGSRYRRLSPMPVPHVFGDAWPAVRCACSSVPPFDRYAVMPVARNVWQHVDAGSPAATVPPLDHRQHCPAPERTPAQPAQPARPVDALKQRRLRVVDTAGGQVHLDRLLGPVVRRHGVALAALLVQPQPPSRDDRARRHEPRRLPGAPSRGWPCARDRGDGGRHREALRPRCQHCRADRAAHRCVTWSHLLSEGPSLPTRVAVALGLQRQPTMIDVHFDVLSGSVVQVHCIDSKEPIDKQFDVHCENRMPSGD